MLLPPQYAEWNSHDQLLCKYIRTKATPPVFYLPAEHTPQSAALLNSTKQQIESKPPYHRGEPPYHYTNAHWLGEMLQRQKEVEQLLQQNPAGQELEGGEMDESMREEGKGEEGLQVNTTLGTDRGETNHGDERETDEESD